MNILEIKNLNFKFDNPAEIPSSRDFTLKDINLSVKEGSIVTLCGPTGCGKSTLLKLLKQEIAPVGTLSGEIRFNGSPITALTLREQAEKIGILLQNTEDQIVTDKVWHELAYGLENLGYSRLETENRIAEIISFFRLESIWNADTAKLSGGQKQLVLLASLFAVSPDLLLLDEPISQLDPEAAEHFLSALKRLHDKLGTTIIIAEHKLNALLPITDTVAIMSEGWILCCGSPGDVKPTLEKVLPPLSKTGYPAENDEKHSEKAKTAVNSDTSESALKIKDLFFRYSAKSPDVLCGLNADFKKGNVYSIFGCNAAGKTTLFEIISGAYKPREGSVKFSKKHPSIAYMPQNTELLFISDTIRGELRSVGLSEEAFPEYIKALNPERSPFDLSGGEKQILAFTKIRALNSEMILLDEPTKGMDVILSKLLIDELKKFTESGGIAIMSTHDLEFSKYASDYCSIMSMGRLTAFKPASEFFKSNRLYTV